MAARIPYDFTPFPRKLHPGWAGRSHASWGLCVRLWLLADGQPIQVHGADWRASLCQQMGIGGRDRPTTRSLMADLQSDGLMTVQGGFVHVVFHPNQGSPGTTELATELVAEESARGSTGVQPGVRQESYPLDLSDRNHSDRFLQTDRQTEKKDSSDARARETTTPVGSGDFRNPLPEPPPNLPPREQPLGEWIAAEHARRHVARTGTTPGGSNRYDLARQIAKWVEGNCEAYKLSNRALATLLLDGLFASDKAGAKGWGLGWILNAPQEFCGLPSGVKPVAATTEKQQKGIEALERMEASWRQQVAAHGELEQLHHITSDRDFSRPKIIAKYDLDGLPVERETEQKFREAVAALRKRVADREATWKRQAEANPIPDEDTWEPPTAAEPERANVVELKPTPQPKRSYTPMSPQQRAEREAQLQEQMRAIRAASAAE